MKRYKSCGFYLPYIIYISVFFISVSNLFSQTYGLKFKGLDESLDNRTELNLTPKKYLTFENEFEISFDYKTTRINPNSNVGLFGYIFRIINRDNDNVDLISSIRDGDEQLNLNIVLGKSDSIAQADYPETLINNWIKLKVKFDLTEDKLIFYTPDSFFVLENIGFKTEDEFKILFGVNNYNEFKTSDVPTMQIRDIKISEEGRLKYHWPLDETDENVATDRIENQKAEVKNPSWLSHKHQIWEPIFENEIKGHVMVTADSENGKIFLVGPEELFIHSVDNNFTKKLTYKNKLPAIIRDYEAIYNSLDKKIYIYLVDEGPAYALDINSGIWEKIKSPSDIPTKFRHHNRYFNSSDNSMYVFGGYGRHRYNNEIRKIDLNEKTLTDLTTDPSVFYPKYLAGLGALNDTVYILGGYGSSSGNQLINPHSYYDMIGYSVKDSTFFKKFEIPHIIDDMCVANTMAIDGETRDYYALVFEKSKFDGHLQLIRGTLNSPNVGMVGNKIPFQFLDVRTSTGLLFMEEQNKLIAYSTYFTDSISTATKTRIHSINYPPNIVVTKETFANDSKERSYLFATAGTVLIFVLIYLFYPKGKEKLKSKTSSVDKGIDKSLLANSSDLIINKPEYQLIFFGGFQAINKNSEDITVHFTPLLKELFLLIWLHTFKNNKGISTEKLTEILWYDKSEKSAQNNRAVNLAKLRSLLSELGSFKLSKKTGYWKAIYNESDINTDYVDMLKLTSSKTNLTKQKINHLIEITSKGPFLRNVQYPWLDEFKANVSETIIDTLIYFANLHDIKEDADFIIHLADSIFIFDVTNEDAMILKCKALYLSGKHSHAKATYEKFSKEYIEMYGQEYDVPFVNIHKNDDQL